MNIVDLIKQQLAGEVTKKLGGMSGIGEADLQKVIGAGLPSLLSGLGSVASTKQGAGKIADAIGGMDSTLFGNLAGMLGGPAGQSGGNMLSGLFGGSLVDGIAAAISKQTGINATLVKTALGFLAPLVMGAIGGAMKGSRPNSDTISKLFSEQKQNIAASMPAGLSLDSIAGFKQLAGTTSSVVSTAKGSVPAPDAGSGLGKFLVPLVVVATIVGGVVFFLMQGKKEAINVVGDLSKAASGALGAATDGAKKTMQNATETVGGAIPELSSLQSDMGGFMTSLTGDLGKITDAASAEAALPSLKDSFGKLDSFASKMNALPTEGKSMLAGLMKGQLEKLNPILDKISAIPGIGDAVKQILNQIKEKLVGLAG